jgi:hypothetical protein
MLHKRDRRCKNVPSSRPTTTTVCPRHVRYETARRRPSTDLCEVCEGESNNDGCERALSSTNSVASVDGNLDVAGRGGDDGAVGAVRWIQVPESVVSECTKNLRTKRLTQILKGAQRHLRGCSWRWRLFECWRCYQARQMKAALSRKTSVSDSS